jgi:hypothetical protein
MARHKHWPEDHPQYERARWCDLPTKGACDTRFTQYQHGHLGRPCVKMIQESKSHRGRMNKIETCSIIESPEVGMSAAGLLAWQLERVNAPG